MSSNRWLGPVLVALAIAMSLIVLAIAVAGEVDAGVWEYADDPGRVVVPVKDPAVSPLVLATEASVASSSRPGCRPYPVGPNSPTGIVGCGLTGPTTGIASWYSGSTVAANWCEWPWDNCGVVTVTSATTGITVDWPVAMYCDCYTGTADERLIDMPRELVIALGLDLAHGLYEVTVDAHS